MKGEMKGGMPGDMFERKIRMWKMRDEMLNSMGEKELRAFIKGYMMGARSKRHHRWRDQFQCNSGSCNCNGNSCGCGGNSCNCEEK